MKNYKKHLLGIACFVLVHCAALGQEEFEHTRWYTFSSDFIGVVGYDFSSDSLISHRFDWDFKQMSEGQILNIKKITKINGHLYYLMQSGTDSSKIMMNVFSVNRPNISIIQLDVSEAHSTFNSIKEANAFVANDTFTRFGLIFYSQNEVDRIRKLRSLQTITKADYKNVLTDLLAVKRNFDLTFNSAYDGSSIFYFIYLPNQMRALLAKYNYNSLVADSELKALDEKFEHDSEIVALKKQVEGPNMHYKN